LPAVERHVERIERHFERHVDRLERHLPSKQAFDSDRATTRHEIIPTVALANVSPMLAPASEPASVQPSGTTEPVVHVTIGRVEVRANVTEPKRGAARKAASLASGGSLADYLSSGKLRRSR
jgi:hypothetical protein